MRTICLCLPEREEATKAAEAHFKEAGVENVEYMWGLDSSVSGLDTTHVYELDAPNSGYRMGQKQTGIWLAHWTCWQVIMRGNDEHVMVLETDAEFLPGWKEKLAEALKVLPTNYDFLHIGSCCTEGHPKTSIGGDVYETKHAFCTHAYIVRRACIPFLLKTLRKVWSPIDIALAMECFPHLNTYVVLPRIVQQMNTLLHP